MRKFLALAASIALALPAVSNADGGPPSRHPGNDRGPPSWSGEHRGYDRDHRYYGAPRYVAPRHYPAYVRYPAPYYGGGRRHGHDDNDDALWAIGGLIVGAVIGSAVERSQSGSRGRSSVPAGPPPGCRDVVVYDSDGTPRVQRDCD